MKRLRLSVAVCFAFLGLCAAQSNVGELRLKVTGPDGLPLKATVELSNDALQFHRSFSTDDAGLLIARQSSLWPLSSAGDRETPFRSFNGRIEIRSALPTDYVVKLSIASVSTAVNVTAEATLLDPDSAGASNHLDQQDITETALRRCLGDLCRIW